MDIITELFSRINNDNSISKFVIKKQKGGLF